MIQMDPRPLTQDRIAAAMQKGRTKLPRHTPGQEFLRGPIPLAWLAQAAALRGKALAVALAIWFKAGATKCPTVRLGRALLVKVSVSRKAGYRGLAALESAGLVVVERHPGRCPVVTICDVAPRHRSPTD